MSGVSKDEEVRQVSAELQARLADLRQVVSALNGILLPPEADPSEERVATP